MNNAWYMAHAGSSHSGNPAPAMVCQGINSCPSVLSTRWKGFIQKAGEGTAVRKTDYSVNAKWFNFVQILQPLWGSPQPTCKGDKIPRGVQVEVPRISHWGNFLTLYTLCKNFRRILWGGVQEWGVLLSALRIAAGATLFLKKMSPLTSWELAALTLVKI